MSNRTKLFKYFLNYITLLGLSACASNWTTSQKQEITPVTNAGQNDALELPAMYQSPYLNPMDTPRTYLEDGCRYLRNKWNPSNAEPGTVVMIIMFNEISNGTALTEDTSLGELYKVMEHLKAQGFEAINTRQFLFFVERNIEIPQRSVLIIQDGSYEDANYKKFFGEFWDKWGWPVVNGWISQPDLPDYLWQENAQLEYEGRVDHQAQGVLEGTVLSDESSKAVIIRELEGSLTAFANHFGKIPYAFIWPGGGFGLRPVEAARQLGYQLGFTANSRGPVMYNWVPLADEVDPDRPSYLPEGYINDPLMTLPRYSPDQVIDAIDAVRATGKEAAEYAQTNKAAEFQYYETTCRDTYGPIPSE